MYFGKTLFSQVMEFVHWTSFARKLYASESGLGVGLDNTACALDSSTIDLCLCLFAWAPSRSTKAAVKLHTLPDLRGAIPAFIHISEGKPPFATARPDAARRTATRESSS